MPSTRSISVTLKALRELGLGSLALNALYRAGLKSGWLKLNSPRQHIPGHLRLKLPGLPSRERVLQIIGSEGLQSLRKEADEVLAGRARLFGGEPVEFRLGFEQPLAHWTAYETNLDLLSTLQLPYNDIKFIWEPARFGFAFSLGRAYHLTGEEKYPAAFWQHFETFAAANPPYLGPNWMSGQEVALRLMAFVWAVAALAASPESTPQRLAALADSIAMHAARIPPTLSYARSQNNNHLLSEAAGLYTASLALPDHPQAAKWRKLGVKWLNLCFERQIDGTGEYVQHSSNYQRLMLQVALWVNALDPNAEGSFIAIDEEIAARPAERVARNDTLKKILSQRARANLAGATQWLLALTEAESGQVANLGANDGAHILPLSSLPFEDFRPTLQAASLAFCGTPAFGPGPWDEMSLWLSIDWQRKMPAGARDSRLLSILHAPDSRAYLRAAHFSSRPSHADQLHLDLWWRGLNLALDPGTYLYNAPAPWDNPLTAASVHNTVTVNGLDQMTRAGKFLYLDWAQARMLQQDKDQLSAEHDGYRRLGVLHRRTVTALGTGWQVMDELIANRNAARTYRLHWLLADWEWSLGKEEADMALILSSPHGPVRLAVSAQPSGLTYVTTLVRAGEFLYGSGPADLVRGWASPTYGLKVPALSLAMEVESGESISFISEFGLPEALES